MQAARRPATGRRESASTLQSIHHLQRKVEKEQNAQRALHGDVHPKKKEDEHPAEVQHGDGSEGRDTCVRQ